MYIPLLIENERARHNVHEALITCLLRITAVLLAAKYNMMSISILLQFVMIQAVLL